MSLFPDNEAEALERIARETISRNVLDVPWHSREQIVERLSEFIAEGETNGRMAAWAIERFFRSCYAYN